MDLNSTKSPTRRTLTLITTALGLGVVLSLGLWDVHHQDVLALRQLMQEHHLLALTLSTYLEPYGGEAAIRARDATGSENEPQLRAFRVKSLKIEQSGGFVVLLSYSSRDELLTSTGKWVQVPAGAAALTRHGGGVTLQRDIAAQLGLPRRTAVAGLASAPDSLKSRL